MTIFLGSTVSDWTVPVLQKDAPSSAADLKDMQCNWFLIEEGDAYRRAGNLPMAVKRYEEVVSVSHLMYFPFGRLDLLILVCSVCRSSKSMKMTNMTSTLMLSVK